MTNMSLKERISALSDGSGKKGSILVTKGNKIQKNIHPSHINSLHFLGNNIITTDYTGFVKMLQIE